MYFLDPIPAGLTRKEFMATLEKRIEGKMAVLEPPQDDSERS
jgi:hypothetical protein